MDVHFVAPDLRHLDQLKMEALGVAFFEDVRPLRGVTGLVDWRLCGMLSQLILRGRLSGELGEQVLIPARPRLALEKLFLFGAGARDEFDGPRFDDVSGRMLDTFGRAKVRAAVMVLPGRIEGLIEPATAIERFLGVAADRDDPDEITLVEQSEDQKKMIPVVDRERRRARALTPT